MSAVTSARAALGRIIVSALRVHAFAGTAVETNAELLAAAFPPNALLRACQELQRECEVSGTAVLRKFVERRSLDQVR
jgi:hypothetical protein